MAVITISTYEERYFRELCKDFDGVLKRKASDETSLQSRFVRSLTAAEMRDMRDQIQTEYPTYIQGFKRRSNYKLLAALTLIITGTILVSVGATAKDALQHAPEIVSGAMIGFSGILLCLFEEASRPMTDQDRHIREFNDITQFASNSHEPSNTIANWYSAFRARAMTGV